MMFFALSTASSVPWTTSRYLSVFRATSYLSTLSFGMPMPARPAPSPLTPPTTIAPSRPAIIQATRGPATRIGPGCCLTVGEHGLARMSLGKWSRRSRITEVRRPLPVPNLGHILQMLANVVVMFIQLLSEQLDCSRCLHTNPRNVLQCVQRKVKTAHFVEHYHVERCGGRSTVHITVYMDCLLYTSPSPRDRQK